MAANHIHFDKLNLACFFESETPRHFFHSKLCLVLSTARKPEAAWLNGLPLTAEQVGCVSDQAFGVWHSNKNWQHRQTKPPPGNRPKDSCSQSSSPAGPGKQTAGPSPGAAQSVHLRLQGICFSTRFPGDMKAAGGGSHFENRLPGGVELGGRRSLSSSFIVIPLCDPRHDGQAYHHCKVMKLVQGGYGSSWWMRRRENLTAARVHHTLRVLRSTSTPPQQDHIYCKILP